MASPTHQLPSTPAPTNSPPTTKARTIILGAGFAGLAAAKTYLQVQRHLDPTPTPSQTTPQYHHDLLILDTYHTPGGVWSRDRIYPGLVCQGANGLFEFSDGDITMVDAAAGFKRYGVLPAERVCGYLERFAEEKCGGGRVPMDGDREGEGRFRGGVRVVRVERKGSVGGGDGAGEGVVEGNEGWVLHTDKGEVFECEKLIVAAGSYNRPHVPVVPGEEAYKGLSVHSHDMGRRYGELIAPPPLSETTTSSNITGETSPEQQPTTITKHILVVGGSKSALEACALFLPANRQRHYEKHGNNVTNTNGNNPRIKYRITWLIHPSPRGVPFMILNIADEKGGALAALSRTFGALHPTCFDTQSKSYQFLHSGQWRLGSWIVAAFWWAFALGISWAAGWGRSVNGERVRPKWGWTFGEGVGWGGFVRGLWAGRRKGTGEEGRMGIEWDVGNSVQVEPTHEVLKVLHGEKTVEEMGMEIEVVRARVKSMKSREVIVVDGEGKQSTVKANAVIWCTGWLPSVNFFDEEEARRVGAPLPIASGDASSGSKGSNSGYTSTAELYAAATTEILQKFPRFRTSPYRDLSFHDLTTNSPLPPARASETLPEEKQITTQPTTPPTTHSNLLRHIVSPWCLAHNDTSIAFVGMTASAATATIAELSALWAVAWCEGLLDPAHSLGQHPAKPTDQDVSTLEAQFQYQTALQNAFMHLRWGSRLSRDADVILEVQGYIDQMCRDVGVRIDRKRYAMELERGSRGSGSGREVMRTLTLGERWTAWKRESFEGYTSKDYDGVVEEWLAGKSRERMVKDFWEDRSKSGRTGEHEKK